MGRRAEGWKLWWDNRYSPPIAYVRFTWGKDEKTGKGRRHLITTGKSDPRQAAKEAGRIYSLVVAGQWKTAEDAAKPSRGLPPLSIADLGGSWLEEFEAAHPNSDTAENWQIHVRAWVGFFGETLDGITPDRIAEWTTHRMAKVVRITHRKERSALRIFLRWCVKAKHIAKEDAPIVPELPRELKGVRTNPRRKREAVDLEPEEVQRMLAIMPEFARKKSRKTKEKVSVRDFAVVQYETTLRPRTVQRLARGVHFDAGWSVLRITSDIDKIGNARDVKLTRRAREALERQIARVVDGEPIFGKHDIRGYYKAAARAAGLPPEKVARVSRYDLRHAGVTHIVEAGGGITGAGYVAGHTQASTTDRYIRMSKRMGDRAVDLRDGTNSGWDNGCVEGLGELASCDTASEAEKAREIHSRALSGRVDSNHRPLDPQSRIALRAVASASAKQAFRYGRTSRLGTPKDTKPGFSGYRIHNLAGRRVGRIAPYPAHAWRFRVAVAEVSQ